MHHTPCKEQPSPTVLTPPLMHATSDGVISLDAEGHVAFADAAATTLLGLALGDLLDEPLISFVHRAELLTTVLHLQRAARERTARTSWICRICNGRREYQWMHMTALPSGGHSPDRKSVLVIRNVPGL